MNAFTPNDVLFVLAEIEGRHFSPEKVDTAGRTRYREASSREPDASKYHGGKDRDVRRMGMEKVKVADNPPEPSLYDWMLRKPIPGFYWRPDCVEVSHNPELKAKGRDCSLEEFLEELTEIARRGIAARKKR